jgi:Rrf2 family transcriptional regulator, cysteine metabolism repressor
MKISQKEDFSLIFMGLLAQSKKKDFIPLSYIAQKTNLSVLFLRHIAGALLKKKLISSREGINGGYKLAKNPQDVKISDILEAFSGGGIILPCKDKSCRANKTNCVCGTFWKKINSKFMSYIDNVTLAEFINQ